MNNLTKFALLLLASTSLICAQPAPPPQPEPDKDTLKLQIQMFQGLYQADEAKLAMAQKQFEALNKQIADLQKQLDEAKKPAIPKAPVAANK